MALIRSDEAICRQLRQESRPTLPPKAAVRLDHEVDAVKRRVADRMIRSLVDAARFRARDRRGGNQVGEGVWVAQKALQTSLGAARAGVLPHGLAGRNVGR